MFETLMMKTFLLLTLSLLCAYVGSIISGGIMKTAIAQGNPQKVKSVMWTAIIVNIIAFIALMFLQSKTPLNMLLMFVFTLSSGFTLGIYTIANTEVVQKAIAITALTTFLTAMVGSYPGLDFSWLGTILFIALLILVVISIIRLFVRFQAGQRFIAAFGVIIFTGYLLFDFNRLAKLKEVAAANNWETALNFAISIYLDIINLLLQLITLLSASSSN
ncbi:MAG: Bax inhibitor-1 family protein [Elusimicrobiota bacterium]|jgi:FtsH-binding integral membrane protein|nr:Bax inhibitor-1 family protein [Elusimicrobiota bacterium]